MREGGKQCLNSCCYNSRCTFVRNARCPTCEVVRAEYLFQRHTEFGFTWLAFAGYYTDRVTSNRILL